VGTLCRAVRVRPRGVGRALPGLRAPAPAPVQPVALVARRSGHRRRRVRAGAPREVAVRTLASLTGGPTASRGGARVGRSRRDLAVPGPSDHASVRDHRLWWRAAASATLAYAGLCLPGSRRSRPVRGGDENWDRTHRTGPPGRARRGRHSRRSQGECIDRVRGTTADLLVRIGLRSPTPDSGPRQALGNTITTSCLRSRLPAYPNRGSTER